MLKVSVVMGAYNADNEIMLKRSVDSIKRQTFKDWELIICDDGSTDKTWKRLVKIAKTDNRIILVRNHKNMGLAAALNNCIEKARGEYIARQDVDDYSAEDRLQKQIDFLDTNKEYSIVGCLSNVFDSEGIWGLRGKVGEHQKKDFLWGTPFVHPTVMMRREDLVRAKCYCAVKETRRTEDYDLFMRMYSLGMKGFTLSEPLFFYFDNRHGNIHAKRKYCYRVDEAFVRYKGFKALGLMPKGLLYIFKPLIVGLIPFDTLGIIRRRYRNTTGSF